MDKVKEWRELKKHLSDEKEVNLPRGGPFKALFDEKNNEILITPLETGIPRTISFEEWEKFVLKFNEIERGPYDELKPGHYRRMSWNSSYLVAITKTHLKK